MTTALPTHAGTGRTPARDRLRALAIERFERSADVTVHFVHGHASLIARACLEMSQRFARGGRLITFGVDASASDVQHVAVEFTHPVIVGKRALPAIPLGSEIASTNPSFVRSLELLGRERDIAMAIAPDRGQRLVSALGQARARGMLTIALLGEPSGESIADFEFAVPTNDPLIVQEVHELLYHVLWELVHVFLEHRTTT